MFSNECLFNTLTTNDALWCQQFMASCYQSVQSDLKIGSVLAERVEQWEVDGWTALADSAWRPLQMPVEKPWSMPGGPFVCFIAQTSIGNAPWLLFWHFRQLLVWRSVLWSEGPYYWTLTNEWVLPRSWTHRECVDKAFTAKNDWLF